MKNPVPIWPEAPRYCPGFEFTRYAYVPGQSPHPRTLVTSHFAFDVEAEAQADPRRMFLYGIDLYHSGYFWESHEVWEALWTENKETNPALADFLQGLILNSAAWLQLRVGRRRGAEQLFAKAIARMRRAVDHGYAEHAAPFTVLDIHIILSALDESRDRVRKDDAQIPALRLRP